VQHTWTKVTVEVPGYASLVIPDTTAKAFDIAIVPFYGTNYTASSGRAVGTWYEAYNYFPDNTSTWFTTNDATLQVTGVQLEVGDTASSFEMRSYNDELRRCQRYYFRDLDTDGTTDLSPGVYACTYQNNHKIALIWLPVPMRATPTMTAVWVNGTYNVAKSSNTRMEGYFSSDNDSNSPIHSTSIKCEAEL
jgi:hypothetical protein